MRKILVAAASTVALSALTVLPAGAQGVTVYLAAASNGLTITEPIAPAVLAGTTGGVVTGTLGTTTVLDLRGASGYTVSIQGSALTPDAVVKGAGASVIPVGSLSVCSSAVTPVSAAQDVALNHNCTGGSDLVMTGAAQPFVKVNNTSLGGLGFATSSTTFVTTLKVNATSAVAGLYTGTFSQTAS